MGRLCSGLLYCRIRAFQQALGYFGARHYCRSWFHTDGIGRALVLAFAKEGAQVAGCSRSAERLDSLEK